MTSSNATSEEAQDPVEERAPGKALQRRPSRKRYDWETIKAAYVEGVAKADDPDGDKHWLNQGEIADRFNVPANRVRERAARERWKDQRVVFQRRITDVRMRERSKALSQQAVDLDSNALNVARMGVAAITARLAEILREVGEVNDLRKAMAGTVDRDSMPTLRGVVDPKEMDALSKAAQTFHLLGQKAIGEDVQRHEVTGPEGGPIEVVSVGQALLEDDEDRLARFVLAMRQSGLAGMLAGEDDVVDAEVDDEEDEDDES